MQQDTAALETAPEEELFHSRAKGHRDTEDANMERAT